MKPLKRLENGEIDLGPWVDGSPDDRGPFSDFRREVAMVMRQALEELAARDGEAAAPAAPDSTGLPFEHFDLSGSAVYELRRVGGWLERQLAAQGGGGATADLVLVEIARTRPALQGELRRRLGIPAATLSGILKEQHARGLVCRSRHPHDARTWLLAPTAAGTARAADVMRAWHAAEEALLGTLAPADRDVLPRLLERAAFTLSRPCLRPTSCATHFR